MTVLAGKFVHQQINYLEHVPWTEMYIIPAVAIFRQNQTSRVPCINRLGLMMGLPAPVLIDLFHIFP